MSHPLTLDELTTIVAERFRSGVPNGWVLGWDVGRCIERLRGAVAPHPVVNHTSFDYSFCNWYEVSFKHDHAEAFWTLTARMSFIAPVCSVHWTEYQSARHGRVIQVAPPEFRGAEAKLRSQLERSDFFELPSEWGEHTVPGIALELSGTRNVTLSKCLFCDYDG